MVNTTGEEVIPIGNQSQLNLLAVELNDASVRYGARLVRRRIQFNFMANEVFTRIRGSAGTQVGRPGASGTSGCLAITN